MKTHLLIALAVVALVPSMAQAQTSGSEEDIQFRTIDFSSQILELHNYGSSTWDMSGWRFCTHDEIDGFDYTSSSGLNGFSLAAGESLFVHWNNDASGADAVNLSALGGAAIDDLVVNGSGDGISMGLYRDGSFSSAASLVDYIQYSFDGVDVAAASPRGGTAVSASLWSATADWISVNATTPGLIQSGDPFPGDSGGVQGPASFSAIPEPASTIAMIFGLAGLGCMRRRR